MAELYLVRIEFPECGVGSLIRCERGERLPDLLRDLVFEIRKDLNLGMPTKIDIRWRVEL